MFLLRQSTCSRTHWRAGILAGAVLASALSFTASAGAQESLPSSGPHCAPALDRPDWRSVWLGHFAGGKFRPWRGGVDRLDWSDSYTCFETRRDCQVWLRSMRAAYQDVEGYRACVVIRDAAPVVHESAIVRTYRRPVYKD